MKSWPAVLCLAAFLIPVPICTARQNSTSEVLLAEKDGLKAVIRIKSPASLADTDWLQIEIVNNGPASRIKTFRLDAPTKNDAFSSSNDLGQVRLGLPTGKSEYTSIGDTIPQGKHTTSTPGVFAGSAYGLQNTDLDYTMHVTLNMELEDGRSLVMQEPGVMVSFRWTKPSTSQIEALQKQAVDLLAKAMTGPKALSAPEQALMRTFFMNEETYRNVTRDQALAALKQRQIEGTTRFSEVLSLVYSRWKTDPVVIAFYLEALRTRGPEAIADLAMFAETFWDDSFLVPIVELIETAAREPINDMALSRGVQFLNRNYAMWNRDASIAPRLSRAVRDVHILLNNQSGSTGAFWNFTHLLTITHDPAMVWFLRPFLSDSTLDKFTSLSSNMPYGVTPMRYSELAANAISLLLGEPRMFDPWQRAKAPSDGPYPEWAEWDKKLAALQLRLDAMPKP